MEVRCEKGDAPVWQIIMGPNSQGRTVVSEAGLQTLMEILQEAKRTPTCRVLTLEGQDGVFCEGMDLDLASVSPETMQAGVYNFAEFLLALRQAPQVVVGCVDGVARAGGIGIVAACDIILASENSSFGLPEINLGLLPAMVLPFLTERMPVQKAKRWILSGLSLDANKAHQLGLVDEVASDTEGLYKLLRRELRQLLRAHPRAAADIKSLTLETATSPLPSALSRGAEYTATCMTQDETIEGLKLFLAGEPLPWFTRFRPKGPTT